MKRALETVNLIRSTKIVYLVLGLIFGITLVIVGLLHTETIGLFQKKADPQWDVVLVGALLAGGVALLYVVLSGLEQMLLALVMIASPAETTAALAKRQAEMDFQRHTDQAMQLDNGS